MGDDQAASPAYVRDQRIELRRRVPSGLDERLDAEVVAVLRLREQLVDRALRLELRLLTGREHLVRLVLRRLDVGLVEGVDLEIRPGHCDRELPAEELGAERVWIRQVRLCRLPVGAVGPFARRGDEPLALLAGRLGDQLLGPEPEATGGLGDADLVAPVAPALAEAAAELVAGIALARAARLAHLLGAFEQARRIGAHQHRGHDPEQREGRVAAADRRLAGEDGTEAALAGEVLELGARVGDRGEAVAALAGLLPEVVGVGAGLERRPRLGGGDEERPLEVELLLECADRPRVGRVEDVKPVDVEGAPQHLRGERRAAHPAEDDVVDLLSEGLGEANNLTELLLDVQRLVEPAEPAGFVAPGPYGRVPLPDALDQALAVHEATRAPRFAITPSSSSLNESENFCTPSCSSVRTTSS